MSKNKTPLILVIDDRRNRVGYYPSEAYFYLELSNWNDYWYYTSYSLHASSLVTKDGKAKLIGHLRILKDEQPTGIQEMLKPGSIEALGSDYCSMASSLDYYERIAQLTAEYRDRILFALRDCIINPDIREEFDGQPGFHSALMRDLRSDDEIFELAPLLISRNLEQWMNMGLEFQFKIPGLDIPIRFDFDAPEYGQGYGSRKQHLPNRIAVMIGRNGSGKSTLLSRIARVAFSSTPDRADESLMQVGEIEPAGLGFPRIIFLSYSAFDAFALPGIYKKEKETILLEMEKGLGRYVFCGIRDVVAELKDTVTSLATDGDGKLFARDILEDRIKQTKLKSHSAMADEFLRNLSIINQIEVDYWFDKVLGILAEEKSMRDILPKGWEDLSNRKLKKIYEEMSTGHKFILHAITSIMAYAAPRSLILFDEPETHLHPPSLAVAMKAIRFILKKRNCFMIVSTHSPVVLQETLKQHVHVVQREGELMSVSQPELETFGENIGALTQMAFGLATGFTDYHVTLDHIIRTLRDDNQEIDPTLLLDGIEELFEDGLSLQARSYVLSKIYNKR